MALPFFAPVFNAIRDGKDPFGDANVQKQTFSHVTDKGNSNLKEEKNENETNMKSMKNLSFNVVPPDVD